jgi:hypothetical protein
MGRNRPQLQLLEEAEILPFGLVREEEGNDGEADHHPGHVVHGELRDPAREMGHGVSLLLWGVACGREMIHRP